MKSPDSNSNIVQSQETEDDAESDSVAIAQAQAGLLRRLCTLAARRWIDRHSSDKQTDHQSGNEDNESTPHESP